MSADIASDERVHVLDHPLIQHKLSHLRDESTGPKEFRELVRELAMLMAYEATRNFPLESATVKTPIMEAETRVLAGKKVAVVPILRAGLGMLDGMLQMLPAARVGHVGMKRNPETLEPEDYYCRLPEDIGERMVMVVDPMLATGGSAAAACRFLQERGAGPIDLLVLLAAPEGVQRVLEVCDDVTIFTCALDSHLNDHGYILPGLGDAGDRLYGTR